MYIEIGTIVLILGLYVFIVFQLRAALNVLVNRVNMLDNAIAEAITKLPFGEPGSFEPINPVQQAIAGLIQNMVTNKQERSENGQFVKATIIEPAQNND